MVQRLDTVGAARNGCVVHLQCGPAAARSMRPSFGGNDLALEKGVEGGTGLAMPEGVDGRCQRTTELFEGRVPCRIGFLARVQRTVDLAAI